MKHMQGVRSLPSPASARGVGGEAPGDQARQNDLPQQRSIQRYLETLSAGIAQAQAAAEQERQDKQAAVHKTSSG